MADDKAGVEDGAHGSADPAAAVETRLAHGGRNPRAQYGFVNPPVYHGSTVTFPTTDVMLKGAQKYTYGRRATPTTDALCSMVAELEGAAGVVLCPSGLSAVATGLAAFVGAGDHMLVPDTVYAPARHFCDTVLKNFGVETTYYDPTIGADIAGLFRPNTRLVHTEAPGSHTFEMQDIPAIAAAARAKGILTAMDNTWASPLYFRALDHGVDISITAATKYFVGHSDVLMGTVAARDPAVFRKLLAYHGASGISVGPDDVAATLRGLRTMSVRLARHTATSIEVARWLAGRPEVVRVLHPALPEDPGHALYSRDFKGCGGLFGVLLRDGPVEGVKAMLDGLRYFGLGYSWGGFESLAILCNPAAVRTATRWQEAGHLVRLYVGLEEPADLIADLEAGLARLVAAGG